MDDRSFRLDRVLFQLALMTEFAKFKRILGNVGEWGRGCHHVEHAEEYDLNERRLLPRSPSTSSPASVCFLLSISFLF